MLFLIVLSVFCMLFLGFAAAHAACTKIENDTESVDGFFDAQAKAGLDVDTFLPTQAGMH